MREDAMKQALRDRRARGLDVSIIVGGAEPIEATDEEQKKLGFAPEGDDPTEEDGENPTVPEQEQEEGMLNKEVTQMDPDDDMQGKMDPSMMQDEMDKMGMGRYSISSKAKMKAMAQKGE